MKHPVDIAAILAYVAGGGLAPIGGVFLVLYPGRASLIAAISLAVVALALTAGAGIARTVANPTQSPAEKAAKIAPELDRLALSKTDYPHKLAYTQSEIDALRRANKI